MVACSVCGKTATTIIVKQQSALGQPKAFPIETAFCDEHDPKSKGGLS